MDGWKFSNVVKKYKKCPNCGSSYKDDKLHVDMENEIITISCDCGFFKQIDDNNKEIETEENEFLRNFHRNALELNDAELYKLYGD